MVLINIDGNGDGDDLEQAQCVFCFQVMIATRGLEEHFEKQVENHLVTCEKNPGVVRLSKLKALICTLIDSSEDDEELVMRIRQLNKRLKMGEESEHGQPKQKGT